MDKDRFNDESRREVENIIDDVYGDVLSGEGSEGLNRLEDYESASDNFLGVLQLIQIGEGESGDKIYDEAVKALEESVASSYAAAVDENPRARAVEALLIMVDLDRRAEEELGEDIALFSNMTDAQIIDSHIEKVDESIEQANPDTYEQAQDYYNQVIGQILSGWHDTILERVCDTAEPNLKDEEKRVELERKEQEGKLKRAKLVKEFEERALKEHRYRIKRDKELEKKARTKKFVRDVGAVALGSLPAVGAMIFFNRKNK